ncbi:hypothetical protein [Crocosphaera sp.]|uniref:hypothetical protein n=1 Tax=Crocosphaera sp. TaxID=2729996 RepID=UPI002612C133|nr:hypothetical protein [Crocosphaera sp.]MDJ0583209.1 hypothetical protein [Crocosphaera sp.]
MGKFEKSCNIIIIRYQYFGPPYESDNFGFFIMCFRDLLNSIINLIKSIFAKDQEYESLKDIPEAKNQEAIGLFNKVLKDQGIAKLQIKHGYQYIDNYVNWNEKGGLIIKTKNISIERLAQSVKNNLEQTKGNIEKNIIKTSDKIKKLDEFIAILEEYNKK